MSHLRAGPAAALATLLIVVLLLGPAARPRAEERPGEPCTGKAYIPPDPGFSVQWGFHNTGQPVGGELGTPGADVNALRAWEMETGTGGPVTVAVIDSGIDSDHPDLDSRIWTNEGEVGGNGVDDDGNGYVDDVHGYNWAGITQTVWADYTGDTVRKMFRHLGDATDTQAYAQSITGTGCDLTHAGIRLARYSSPASGVSVSVREHPEGPTLASFDVAPAEVSYYPWSVEVYKQLSAPVRLAAGRTYYLVFETDNCDSGNHYCIYETQQSAYGDVFWPGGQFQRSGSGWSAVQETNDFYFRTNPNCNPEEDACHGTPISGIVAAEHDGEGVVGMSSGAQIMPLKVLDCSGPFMAPTRTGEICQAIRYAADNGADIVTMCFGSTEFSQEEQEAVDYAHSKGVMMFAAAGNFGDSTVWYPAGCDHVIGVGATDNQDRKASFSEVNATVDLAAPGAAIYAPLPKGGHGYLNGTSAAVPFAAGLAALIMSARPSLETEEVGRAMLSNAEDLGDPGRDDCFGAGRIDAGSTLASLLAPSLDSLSVGRGAPGDELVLRGTNFRAQRGGSTVDIGSRSAPVTTWGDDTIVCRVPAVDAGRTTVSVTTAAGETSSLPFTVTTARWYLPEGSSAWGFSTYLSLENPNPDPVHARITYMTRDGGVDGGTAELPAMSQTTVNPAEVLGEQDFSTLVECAEGESIAADRTMSWTGEGAPAAECHCSLGLTSPATTWYLAEGSSAWGFETWLLIQNPNPRDARCRITYMPEGGIPVNVDRVVPAGSRVSCSMAEDIGEADASVKVTSDIPVVPERSMYRYGRREGHDSVGTCEPAREFYLAEGTTKWGFTTYVLVQNPNPVTCDVTVTYMTPDGESQGPVFSMPPDTRTTIRVNDTVGAVDLSTRVSGTRPIVAERAMYWGSGSTCGEACHCSLGADGPHETFMLPDGCDGAGWETYTLVQNPDRRPLRVEVSYLSPGGGDNVVFEDTVPGRSRVTYRMGDRLTGRAAVLVRSLEPGRGLVAERSMYGDGRTRGAGTVGAHLD